MNQNHKISESLMELSDALEQLALVIAQQKFIDQNTPDKQFDLIVDKFKKTTNVLAQKELNRQPKLQQQHGFLEKWLLDRNIQSGKHLDTLKINEKLYAIADFLADHYFQLKDFYEQLKRAQVIKKDFKMTSTKKQISYIKKWCKMLHDNKLIDSFYFLDEETVDIDIAKIHDAHLFISGSWLEIFLRKELGLIFRKHLDEIETFDILAQVEIVKPNNKSSELDLLIMLNEKVYWFECKSGQIGKTYIERFAEHRKLMQLPPENSFLVVPQLVMNQSEVIYKRCGMKQIHATSLSAQLEHILFD